jgi:hypothetical protein
MRAVHALKVGAVSGILIALLAAPLGSAAAGAEERAVPPHGGRDTHAAPGLIRTSVFGKDDRQSPPSADVAGGALVRITCRDPQRHQRVRSSGVIVDVGLPAESPYRAVISVAHAFEDGRRGVVYDDCRVVPRGNWWWHDLPIVSQKRGAFDESYARNQDDWALVLVDTLGQTASPGLKPQLLPTEDSGALAPVNHAARLYAHNARSWRYERADRCSVRTPNPAELLFGQRMLLSDCDAIPGASGGPVVIDADDGSPRLLGVYRGPVFAQGRYASRPPNHVEHFDAAAVANAVVPLRPEWLSELQEMAAQVAQRKSILVQQQRPLWPAELMVGRSA